MTAPAFVCPVCELPTLTVPPEMGPVCPACGTEFEVDDRYRSCAELRRDWISIGAPWFSSFEPPPPNWHAIQRALLTHREASTVNVVPVQSQAAQPNFGWIVPPSFDWKAA